MDGDDDYAVCPSSTTETFSFPLPEFCLEREYYHGGGCHSFDSDET